MLLVFVSLFCVTVISAQEQANRYEEITNPNLTHLNKEAPRASFFSFGTADEAVSATNSSKGSRFILLNGTWKFHYVQNFDERLQDGFFEENYNDSSWNDIRVPGNWEVQGFGTPIYVNATYEFTSPGHPPYWDNPNPPLVPRELNAVGTYRKQFDLPQEWLQHLQSRACRRIHLPSRCRTAQAVPWRRQARSLRPRCPKV